MKILLVIDGMHPRHGGPPPVVAGSAIALISLGHQVTVITTVTPGDEPAVRQAWAKMLEAGVALKFFAPIGLRDLLLWPKEKQHLKREVESADVVHLHGIWNPILLVVGKLARESAIPYLVSVHGVLDHRAIKRVRRKWIKKRLAISLFRIGNFLQEASSVIFGSEAEASESWMLGRKLKVVFIGNGADAYSNIENADPVLLKKFQAIAPGYESWGPVLLSHSRIHPEKGLDMLVAAFSAVAHDFPEARLLIAGLRQDIAFEQRIIDLIAQSPISKRIIFTTELTGPKSLFLYKLCDVFVLPSIAEGFSVALTQALANAKPVLVTRFCHMPIIADMQAGFVVEPEVGSIANGLRSMLSLSAIEIGLMGANARQVFESNYTWEIIGIKLVEAYGSAISEMKRS